MASQRSAAQHNDNRPILGQSVALPPRQLAGRPFVALTVVTADVVWLLFSIIVGFPARLKTVFQASVAALSPRWVSRTLRRVSSLASSSFHAKATTATVRRQLISIAARVTRSARRSTLRMPTAWPWADAWQRLLTAAIGPPAQA